MDRAVIGAFSEDQVAKLTGLSRAQLRQWNRNGFIRPSFKASDDARKPYNFIYSFTDLLKLRVLNQLRNKHGVSMQELRKVERALDHLGDDKWTKQKLWVSNRKVVFNEPESLRKREISSRQFVAEIALEVVTSDAREDIRRLNDRDEGAVGQVVKRRHFHSSEPVFAGTRIPVAAIVDYIEAGYSNEQIIGQFPSLRDGDIEAARSMPEAA
ncbi:hypothetical protein CP98_03696 [Sphingobium yanoikuyae]|uniref:HTH merR-type domain-containing protein n=1 Tax=Sphingobium yanoikuyae TaxID=13690 RepID=A0A084EGV6_SPHYA|nr:DUF433 domain-containing protein [Sphingobium yanoikuyae]KEZ17198.1 hypothetical protein CP98_03696 [Sphingobium yanoikuyae]